MVKKHMKKCSPSRTPKTATLTKGAGKRNPHSLLVGI
jgi:hypothetical protein